MGLKNSDDLNLDFCCLCANIKRQQSWFWQNIYDEDDDERMS